MFLFVIVLYKCNLNASQAYNSMTMSLLNYGISGELFIWDNSPEQQKIINVKETIWNHIEYVHCPENKGLGIAYNMGAEYAKKKQKKFIVLLDQDTVFDIDFVQKSVEAIDKNKDIGLFAPKVILENTSSFSPFIYKYKRGKGIDLPTNHVFPLNKYMVVNSGMIINIDHFFNVNGYNVLVKLDFADTQFLERYRKVYSDFFLVDTIAIQDFSNKETDYIKLKNRFEIYCECARLCEKDGIFDHIQFTYSVFLHTLALIFRTKKISFFLIFVQRYLLRKTV